MYSMFCIISLLKNDQGILLFIITKINLHTILIRRFVHSIKVTKIKSEKEAKQGKQVQVSIQCFEILIGCVI